MYLPIYLSISLQFCTIYHWALPTTIPDILHVSVEFQIIQIAPKEEVFFEVFDKNAFLPPILPLIGNKQRLEG